MATLLCATVLSACTATTIDTQNLQSVGNLERSTANFGLTDGAVIPEPTNRPAASQNQLPMPTPISDDLAAPNLLAASPTGFSTKAVPTAPGTQVFDDSAASDNATQRILQASNAPSAQQAVATSAGSSILPVASAIAAPTIATSTAPVATAIAPAPKRTGIFRTLFNRERLSPPADVKVASAAPKSKTPTPPKRVVSTVSAQSSSLPGVDKNRVLGIKGASGEDRPRVQLASAAGLARLTPNGLKTQHSGVDIKCLKPALVRILKQVESKYGKPTIVTSGYRSPARNKSARGAKNSLHMYCAAADIQVSGVGKWELASYLRSMAGRGGVGTYCHTKSVHIDIGPKRDWNARCRRR